MNERADFLNVSSFQNDQIWKLTSGLSNGSYSRLKFLKDRPTFFVYQQLLNSPWKWGHTKESLTDVSYAMMSIQIGQFFNHHLQSLVTLIVNKNHLSGNIFWWLRICAKRQNFRLRRQKTRTRGSFLFNLTFIFSLCFLESHSQKREILMLTGWRWKKAL